MEERLKELEDIYRRFEERAREFLLQAACRPGCAQCCIDVGRMDMTTLEGLNVLRGLEGLKPALKKRVLKRLKRDASQRSKKRNVRCGFLDKNDLCLIYAGRPFSCRQLYSVKPCDGGPPTVHRAAHAMSRAALKEIKRLDRGGLFGHIPRIVALLLEPDFKNEYLRGGLTGDKAVRWAEKHGLTPNQDA